MTDNLNNDSRPEPHELPIDEINENRPQPMLDQTTIETVDTVDPSEATGRGEGIGEALETKGLSQGQIVLRRFFRHKGALFGITTIILIALLSFSSMGFGPIKGWWKHQDALRSATVQNLGKPTLGLGKIGDYPFGQDTIGRDNFAMVMEGVQSSLVVMILMSLVAVLIGVTIGALSGYYRGTVDMILMRFTDMVITLPTLVIAVVLGKLVGVIPQKMGMNDEQTAAMWSWMPVWLGLALGCLVWPGLARLTRSEFLSLREREFVDSARVAGASDFRIITKHMLPNALGVIIVNTSLLMAASVLLETGLSFLGFGIREPSISLGNLISQYQSAFATRPWLFWWPGLFIVLIALAVNFIGDGLRDAFDPRTKRIPSKRQMDKAAKLDAPSFEAEQATSAARLAAAGPGTTKEGSK